MFLNIRSCCVCTSLAAHKHIFDTRQICAWLKNNLNKRLLISVIKSNTRIKREMKNKIFSALTYLFVNVVIQLKFLIGWLSTGIVGGWLHFKRPTSLWLLTQWYNITSQWSPFTQVRELKRLFTLKRKRFNAPARLSVRWFVFTEHNSSAKRHFIFKLFVCSFIYPWHIRACPFCDSIWCADYQRREVKINGDERLERKRGEQEEKEQRLWPT